VSCPITNLAVVAIKMGGRSAGCQIREWSMSGSIPDLSRSRATGAFPGTLYLPGVTVRFFDEPAVGLEPTTC
jgi:hypothetical protein